MARCQAKGRHQKCDNRMRQGFCRKNDEKSEKAQCSCGSEANPETRHAPAREIELEARAGGSRRRARVAELAASGLDLRQCEELLKQEGFLHTDHATLGRDLQRERDRLNQATQNTVARHRDQLTKNLLSLEQVVRERGLQHDDYVPDLLAIFNQLAKLLGLNADTRVAVVARGQRHHTTRETGGLAPVASRDAVRAREFLRRDLGCVPQAIATADGGDDGNDRTARGFRTLAR